ncbi:histidinol-phosphate transaminase [Streptomyces sp. NPDC052013]|uniref:histidinol-phosphate transaminase n=1 Tax=Streptomyces sp. NPDC052013 TaxID=3365679 RepID=UPI0037D1F7BC
MSKHVRKEINQLPAYQPIPNPSAVAKELGLSTVAKLDTNETPYGPLFGVHAAITAAAHRVHEYPDLASTALTSALADHYDIDPEGIAVGNGSAGLIEAVIKGVASPGAEVIYSWRSFEAYPLITTIAGAVPRPVPRAPDHRHDLDAILAAINIHTRIILLCNPSNPTGTYLPPRQIVEFLDQIPRNVLVVLDEAYFEFITPRPSVNTLTMAALRRNVIALRSFSKAWGLAGLRTGWLYTNPALARAIRKCIVPFSVNTLAQAAAAAALTQEAAMNRRATRIAADRDRIVALLRKQTPEIPTSQGNFFWVPLRAGSASFAEAAKHKGIIVRSFSDEGVRITIGTTVQNDQLIAGYPQMLESMKDCAC